MYAVLHVGNMEWLYLLTRSFLVQEAQKARRPGPRTAFAA